MSLSLVMKLLHVLAAMGFISGIIGRSITFGQAAKSTNVHTSYTLLQVSEFFERKMVIPAGGAVFLLGLITAWLQGWPIFGFLQGASSNWLLVSIVLLIALLPAIPLYLIPRRQQRAKAAEEALAQGTVTPELTAALTDKGVITYRMVEFTIAVVITILMVTKPF